MKAIIMYPGASAPELGERPKPSAISMDQVLLQLKTVAIKNLDISKAKGNHYSSTVNPEGQIIGTDGVGITPEGTRVYGVSREGMLAEYSLVDTMFSVPVPDGLDDASAAAIPNAVMGSALALLFRAKMQPGETVLINGATGVTGRMAIQVARYYGAGSIIVTGRNEASWPELQQLGADKWITLNDEKEQVSKSVGLLHKETPIDIVLDYLWGASATAILDALKGNGGFAYPTRYVSIGGMTGDTITLSSSILRSTPIVLMGSGLGSWSKAEVAKYIQEILPVFFQLAADGKLQLPTKLYQLEEIKEMWDAKLPSGVRAVVRVS